MVLFFIDIFCQKVLLGWLAKVNLTTQILRPDVVWENVVVDVVVVENIAVVSPHVVGEDIGGTEGVCRSRLWHKSRASSDGNTAVEGRLRVGVEHLGVGVGWLDKGGGGRRLWREQWRQLWGTRGFQWQAWRKPHR